MLENPNPITNPQEEINKSLQDIMNLLSVKKVIYIDDAFELDTGKEEFKGLINRALNNSMFPELKNIKLQDIDFSKESTILLNHIDEVWDGIKPTKKLKYFEQVLGILNENNTIVKDYRNSNSITSYFNDEILFLLKPHEWDEQRDAFYDGLKEGEKIILFIDQDLQHARTGRYNDRQINGEEIILELKRSGNITKSINILFTHTINNPLEELSKRFQIIQEHTELSFEDFLPLAKVRLDKMANFADGIKKACLNTRFELIKNKTNDIFDLAYSETSNELSKLDTYHFDEAILKSSENEGVWEVETYLRIFDILFNENFKKKILTNNYITTVNKEISLAKEISNIRFKLDDKTLPNEKAFSLRHKEIYENGDLINRLRLEISNGDIFTVFDGNNQGDYILVSQECNLIVRADGLRSGSYGYFFKIESLTTAQLSSQIKNRDNKGQHYYSDKFLLPYFIDGSNNENGVVKLSEEFLVDLDVLDMAVFNDQGEVFYDLKNPIKFNNNLYNKSWCNRHSVLLNKYIDKSNEIDNYLLEIEKLTTSFQPLIRQSLNLKVALNNNLGIAENYKPNLFTFGIKRKSRLRNPYAKSLLDKYALYLSREANLHDFAKN